MNLICDGGCHIGIEIMNMKRIISPYVTLIQALRHMDEIGKKLLVICEGKTFIGVISIGDIQRALLNKDDLAENVCKYIRPDMIFMGENDSIEDIKNMMQAERIECMPIVDKNKCLLNIIEWEDVFNKKRKKERQIDCPVVIMAGGRGHRLEPLTNIIPKPLIPISDKTIIEEIMERFFEAGCREFILSINYKGQLIREYFSSEKYSSYEISFIEEKDPLGTGGSLYFLKDSLSKTFIVSNCDILIDVDWNDLIQYHKSNANIVTVVSVIKNYDIPYGTIETCHNGLVKTLKEKPNINYQINSGVYIFEPLIFDYMKADEFIHIPDLLLRIINLGGKIGAFPVLDSDWVDMGNWQDYLKLINRSNNVGN